MNINASKIHDQVRGVIQKANHLAKQSFGQRVGINYKMDVQPATNIVTEVDFAIEECLKKELSEIVPNAGFIGEESGNIVTGKYNWIVDPLDGTLNYAKNIPLFSISIALWYENTPIYGLISLPMQNQLVHAINGSGIFVNNEPFQREKKQVPTQLVHPGINKPIVRRQAPCLCKST